MKKAIAGAAVAASLALTAVASAEPTPGCMSHSAYVVTTPHAAVGDRLQFGSENASTDRPYDPAFSPSDFKAACR